MTDFVKDLIKEEIIEDILEMAEKEKNTIFTDELITDICEQLEEECIENTLFIAQQYQ
tara:strand:- start:653 stop:826 length:174 start_codon:yes stop_codon:yes gene_type:complete